MKLSALFLRFLADDDLEGGQLSPGTPTSLPKDQVLINQLSLYSSLLALKAQHAASGYDKLTIYLDSTNMYSENLGSTCQWRR